MCGRMEHSEWTSTQGGLIVDAKSLKRFTFDIKTGMVLHASGERVGKPVVGRVLIDGTFYTRAQVAYMLHYGETVTRIAFADKNNRNLRPGNLIPISIVSVGSSSTVKVTVRKNNATTFLGYHCSMHAAEVAVRIYLATVKIPTHPEKAPQWVTVLSELPRKNRNAVQRNAPAQRVSWVQQLLGT